MRNLPLILAFLALGLASGLAAQAPREGVAISTEAQGAAITTGRYEGELDIGGGRKTPIVLRLLPSGGGLVDLPMQGLYGYPLASLMVKGDSLAFLLGTDSSGGAPGNGDGTLRFDAKAFATGGALVSGRAALRLEGKYSKGDSVGPFHLLSAPDDESAGYEVDVAMSGGSLRGSLLVPEGPQLASPPPSAKPTMPLVILVAGAGATDRDGNNYNVPGKNDGLRELALALADRGVATYRYDKRGAGESYVLAGPEAASRFSDYVDDAVAIAQIFALDNRFSRLVFAGHTEGALVATAATRRLEAMGARVDGLALLCASGKTAIETVEEALADTPSELKAEAEEIMAELKAGKIHANPSEYFADFFRPSFQPWLASWFTFDVRADLAAIRAQLVFVQGDRDFQVDLQDFALLAGTRPTAPAFVVPEMNHVLKAVPAELEENYRSFSDPGFPLAPGLAELVAAFAEGGALPAGLPRLDSSGMEAK